MLLDALRDRALLHIGPVDDHAQQVTQTTPLGLLTQTTHDATRNSLQYAIVLAVWNSRVVDDSLTRMLLHQVH
ncbi:hypothetical protein GCM10028816_01470 [Spirosoma lituiforme]